MKDFLVESDAVFVEGNSFYCGNGTWSAPAVTLSCTLPSDVTLQRPGKPDVKLGELADRYNAECEERARQAEIKKHEAEQEKEARVLGAVAVALSGAGAMANKNPVVSRRFWSWGRKQP